MNAVSTGSEPRQAGIAGRWIELAVALPATAAVVLVLLFFWKLAFTNLILARGDTLLYFYPYWDYRAHALLAGHLPLWDPLLFMGAPFLANSQAGVLYPLNWPLALLPAPQAVKLAIVVHLAIAALGVYAFSAPRAGPIGAGRLPGGGAVQPGRLSDLADRTHQPGARPGLAAMAAASGPHSRPTPGRNAFQLPPRRAARYRLCHHRRAPNPWPDTRKCLYQHRRRRRLRAYLVSSFTPTLPYTHTPSSTRLPTHSHTCPPFLGWSGSSCNWPLRRPGAAHPGAFRPIAARRWLAVARGAVLLARPAPVGAGLAARIFTRLVQRVRHVHRGGGPGTGRRWPAATPRAVGRAGGGSGGPGLCAGRL